MKVAVLLSGGLDSTTALYWAHSHHEVVCALSFDYGSNHSRREIECAKYHCEKLGIEHIVIPLDFIGKYFIKRQECFCGHHPVEVFLIRLAESFPLGFV